MQIVAIHCGENKTSNVLPQIAVMQRVFEEQGVEFSCIDISDKCLVACDACEQCKESQYAYCEWGDASEWCYEAMRKADGVILASSGVFGNAMPGMLGLMDKVVYLSQQASQNNPAAAPLRRKVCTPLVAVDNDGAIETYMSILAMCECTQMIVPAAPAWTIADPANPSHEEDSSQRLTALAHRMVEILRLITA